MMTDIVNDCVQRIMSEQRHIYDIILQSVIKNERKIIFLDAPDETKKTFLTTAILTEVKRQEKYPLQQHLLGFLSHYWLMA